jgi:hypothetical protein
VVILERLRSLPPSSSKSIVSVVLSRSTRSPGAAFLIFLGVLMSLSPGTGPTLVRRLASAEAIAACRLLGAVVIVVASKGESEGSEEVDARRGDRLSSLVVIDCRRGSAAMASSALSNSLPSRYRSSCPSTQSITRATPIPSRSSDTPDWINCSISCRHAAYPASCACFTVCLDDLKSVASDWAAAVQC